MAFAQAIGATALTTPKRSLPALTPAHRPATLTGRRQSCTIVAAKNFKTRETEQAISSKANKANVSSDEFYDKANAYLDAAKSRWDKVEEKPAAVAIGVTALIVVWAASGLVDRIDKLPIVGGLLELVGLVVTGWFVYRYLIFGPDRDELKESLDKFLSKVTGKSTTVDEVRKNISNP